LRVCRTRAERDFSPYDDCPPGRWATNGNEMHPFALLAADLADKDIEVVEVRA
jgi:hypothetical protein